MKKYFYNHLARQ